MSKAKQFNLLMVRDDGSRVLRLSIPGWAVGVVVGGLAVIILGLAFIYPDYVNLRHQRGTFAALSERLHIQQGLLDASQSRLREIRGEIDSWRDLHAKIWEPFGPEAAPVKRGTGIGGKTAAEPVRGPVKEEMDRLLGIVREEGESIRTLERFLGRASRVLASLPSRWPVRGPVNSDFGQRRSPWAPNSEFHSGIDIGAPIGTPVRAPAPGVVVFAGQHTSTVSPSSSITATTPGPSTATCPGSAYPRTRSIRRGDTVAMTGNTGRSSGPHLHYEIQVKGQPVNPHSYIWEESPPTVARSAR